MKRDNCDVRYEVVGTMKNERVYANDVFTTNGRYVYRNGSKWIDAIASDEAIRIADKLNLTIQRILIGSA
jgi:hypothetical protein